MLTRRLFLTSSLCALASCGGGGSPTSVVAAPSPPAPPAPTPVPPAPPPPPPSTPAPAPGPPPPANFLQVEGDSFTYAMFTWELLAKLGDTIILNAQSGSEFRDIRDRIVAKPDLRANPLLIWDGNWAGHVFGSFDAEAGYLADIVAYKAPFQNWLIVAPIPISALGAPAPQNDPMALDIRLWVKRIRDVYGPDHVYDPLPLLQSMSSGSAADVWDVMQGFPPGSVMSADHPNEDAKKAIADAITAPGGPLERMLRL